MSDRKPGQLWDSREPAWPGCYMLLKPFKSSSNYHGNRSWLVFHEGNVKRWSEEVMRNDVLASEEVSEI